MSTKQLSSLTGRKIRPDYRGVLGAKRAMLPYIKSRELEDARYKEGMALTRQRMKTEEDFQREQIELQKKQQKKAQLIAATGLGIDAYQGYKTGQVLDKMGGTETSRGFLDTLTSSSGTMIGQGSWWDSAKSGAAGGAMGGLTGGYAGASLLSGQMPEWLGGALGGGIGGALMSGGNIYGAIGGAIVGGGLGSFL